MEKNYVFLWVDKQNEFVHQVGEQIRNPILQQVVEEIRPQAGDEL
jgi:hypothetical protein